MNILSGKTVFQHCTVSNYWVRYTVVQNDCDCLKFYNFVQGRLLWSLAPAARNTCYATAYIKIKIYRTVIFSALCGCETWCVTLKSETEVVFNWLGFGSTADFCEQCNEPSVSPYARNFVTRSVFLCTERSVKYRESLLFYHWAQRLLRGLLMDAGALCAKAAVLRDTIKKTICILSAFI